MSEVIKGAARLKDELYADYKERIKDEKKKIKFWLSTGRIFWDTSKYGQLVKKDGGIKNMVRSVKFKKKKIHHNYFSKKYANIKSFTQHKLNQGIYTKVIKGLTRNVLKKRFSEIIRHRKEYKEKIAI